MHNALQNHSTFDGAPIILREGEKLIPTTPIIPQPTSVKTAPLGEHIYKVDGVNPAKKFKFPPSAASGL